MGRVRTTLDKPTRTQAVMASIRQMILSGELGAGERLQEQMLADKLAVSRTPVHDSLKTLASEGLLYYEPHCGFVVRRFDVSDVVNAFDVRMVLEGFAARTVASRGLCEETAALLEHNLDRAHAVLHGPRWSENLQAEWFTLNWQFHDAILARAANPYITKTVQHVRVIPTIHDRAMKLHTRGELAKLYRREQSQKALADHLSVFKALKNGQADRAEFLLRDHIFCNGEEMIRNFHAAQERIKAGLTRNSLTD